jgi:hypothetical protein
MTKALPMDTLESLLGPAPKPPRQEEISTGDDLILYSDWGYHIGLLDPNNGVNRVIATEKTLVSALSAFGHEIMLCTCKANNDSNNSLVQFNPWTYSRRVLRNEDQEITAIAQIPYKTTYNSPGLIYAGNHITGDSRRVRTIYPDIDKETKPKVNGIVNLIAHDPKGSPTTRKPSDRYYYCAKSDDDYYLYRFGSDKVLVREETEIARLAAQGGVLYYSINVDFGSEKVFYIKSYDVESCVTDIYKEMKTSVDAIIPRGDKLLIASNLPSDARKIKWVLSLIDKDGIEEEIFETKGWVITAVPVRRDLFGGLLE